MVVTLLNRVQLLMLFFKVASQMSFERSYIIIIRGDGDANHFQVK